MKFMLRRLFKLYFNYNYDISKFFLEFKITEASNVNGVFFFYIKLDNDWDYSGHILIDDNEGDIFILSITLEEFDDYKEECSESDKLRDYLDEYIHSKYPSDIETFKLLGEL